MILIGDETPFDVAAREALLDVAMGSDRKQKASERLREGQLPADGLALAARDVPQQGMVRFAGTVRLWHVLAGDAPALLLGPLAVAPERQSDGIGARLMRAAIVRARAAGHGAILLVGDPEYYVRFGFTASLAANLQMPGPYQQHRLLGLELVPGALAGASGMLAPPAADRRLYVAGREGDALRWSAPGLSHAA